jgi:S-adenosyl-L-methionine hydrolase (adenosine-forming)
VFHKPLITMTTDFGYADPFVGVMKGVIYGINPQTNIVDLTHDITPQGIKDAAFVIGMHYHYFPKNSVHLVVVDPGVGSKRRPILVAAREHYFIGPDNGVFSYIYNHSPEDFRVVHITSEQYFLMKHSPSFQGRDVFAPCAAWLSTGKDLSNFGEAITDPHVIDLPAPVRQTADLLKGEVIFIDRFGNAVTNIKRENINALVSSGKKGALRISLKGIDMRLMAFYSEENTGTISALINSSGYLEVFIFKGSAATQYNILPGDHITVCTSS